MMKKYIFTILITLFAIVTTTSQQTDVEKYGYKGKVKSVIKTKCDYTDIFGEYVKENCFTSDLYKYDQNGNKIEESKYNSVGTLDEKNLYKYDQNGNKIEWSKYSDGTLDWKYLYKYDQNGNNIERSKYNSDGTLYSKELYKYDSNGNEIESIEYKGEALIPVKLTETTYEYYE